MKGKGRMELINEGALRDKDGAIDIHCHTSLPPIKETSTEKIVRQSCLLEDSQTQR